MSTLPKGCTCTVTLPDLYCSLHKAAPRLLEALELIRDTASEAIGCEDYQTYDDVLADIGGRLADAAIAEAEEGRRGC